MNEEDNNLVNNDEVSNLASEYEPEGNYAGEDSEDYDDYEQQYRGAGGSKAASRRATSPSKKKKPAGGKQSVASRQSLQLLRSQSSGKLGRRK